MMNRGTLPAEYNDPTSARMLSQPLPQYIYAQLFKSAVSGSLNPGAVAPPGRPAIGSQGAPGISLEEMRLNLADPTFSAAIKVVPELGKGPGHTVRMNRPTFASSAYGDTRKVPSGGTISTTPLAMSMEQVTITNFRWAGPHGASTVQPIGVDRFDASMSIHKFNDLIGDQLVEDFNRFMHVQLRTLLEGAANIVRPDGFAADSAFIANGAGACDMATVLKVGRTLKNLNIKPFSNGRYALVLDPSQVRDLALDPVFARYAKESPPTNPVLAMAYFRTVNNIDIFESNELVEDTTTVSGVTIYHGQAFGPNVLGAGMGMLPEPRLSTADNYGETGLIIWLMYGGWSLLDDRFVVNVRTTARS